MELSEIDLVDSRNFVSAVPHEWFAELRRQAPVYWHEEPDGPGLLGRHQVRRLRGGQP